MASVFGEGVFNADGEFFSPVFVDVTEVLSSYRGFMEVRKTPATIVHCSAAILQEAPVYHAAVLCQGSHQGFRNIRQVHNEGDQQNEATVQ
jgi:hypothetical protein